MTPGGATPLSCAGLRRQVRAAPGQHDPQLRDPLRLRGARAVAAAAAALVLAAGCGDDDADPVGEAADGVAAVVAERVGADAGDVDVACPEDTEVVAGAEFTCSVAVDGADAVDVPLGVDGTGTVELRRAVVPTEAAEAYLVGELTGPAEGPVTVDCGDEPLLVADVGDDLRCEVVRTADGAVRVVTLTVLGLDGTVRYRVEPAAP